MIHKPLAAAAIVAASIITPTPASSYSTASTPVIVTAIKLFPTYTVTTTVTLDAEAVVTVTSEALRHPRELEYSAVLPAGSHTIQVPCKSTRLPHEWTVNIGGERASRAALKCE